MPLQDINTKVAERIQKCGVEVQDAVIESLANKEISRRVDALVKGVDQLEALQKEGKKIKPDVKLCDDAGKVIGEHWSPKAAEERQKHLKKVDKLTKSIEKGLSGDFSDLFNIIKSGGKIETEEEKPAATE